MKKTESQIKSVRLDSSVVQRVEKRAIQENRNFSNMVETILKEATKRNLA
tara:strand:+ start:2583 stop:2732 length:150 start_codon:yes stop_codon:yes gene_type:complete